MDGYDAARLPMNLKESSFCAHSMPLCEGELQSEAHAGLITFIAYENSILISKSLETDFSGV